MRADRRERAFRQQHCRPRNAKNQHCLCMYNTHSRTSIQPQAGHITSADDWTTCCIWPQRIERRIGCCIQRWGFLLFRKVAGDNAVDVAPQGSRVDDRFQAAIDGAADCAVQGAFFSGHALASLEEGCLVQ